MALRPIPVLVLLAAAACGGASATSPPSAPVAATTETPTQPPVTVVVPPSPSPSPSPASSPPVTTSTPDASETTSAPIPAQGDTCNLHAQLRALPSTDGYPHYTLTLTNRGKKPLRLVEPGDGSEVGWRTPTLTWIATDHGKPATPAEAGRCGMSNQIEDKEVFTLAPGASRELKDWLGFPRFVPGTYDVSVRYINDPNMVARKAGVSPAVAAKLATTSTCDVTTNTVRTTLKN